MEESPYTGGGLTWDGGSEGHEHHGGDGVPEAHGAAEVGRQVPDDGGQQADDADGHAEARPAVPVLGGRHAGEQHLPEHGDEVHDVVQAGGQVLLVIVLVAWEGDGGGTGREREREGDKREESDGEGWWERRPKSILLQFCKECHDIEILY